MDRFRFASIVITLIATVVAMTSTFTSSWLVVKERNTTIRSGLVYRCEDDSCLLVIGRIFLFLSEIVKLKLLFDYYGQKYLKLI